MAHHHHLHRRGNQLEGRNALAGPLPAPIAAALALPVADPLPANDNKAPPAQTVVSVIFVTASKTFSGPVAGYTTMAVGSPLIATAAPPPPVQSPSEHPSPQPTDISFNPQDLIDSTTDGSSTTATSSSSSNSTSATTTLANSSSAHALTTGPTSVSPASASGSGSSLSQSSPSGGLSGAAKAGIALAVLIGVGLLLSAVLLFYRRKKKLNDSYGKASDEGSSFHNNGSGFADSSRDSTRGGETVREAPQLSLRPVTQFLPNLGSNRKSAGSPLAMAAAVPAGRHDTPSPTSSANGRERNLTQSPTSDPANPFGNHAEASERPTTAGSGATGSGVDASVFPAPSNGLGAGVAGAMAVRQKAPPPLDLSNRRKFSADASASQISLPLSDAGTENSRSTATTVSTPVAATAAAAAAAAAGASGHTPSPPVHRVQLDFKPSMSDELGLRAGQLVRLLHEYDDGWVSFSLSLSLSLSALPPYTYHLSTNANILKQALCIRLDRSQQGVCPRTCLSKQPVKPRPNPRSGPSSAVRTSPQGRPMAPPVQPPRSASPARAPHSPGALAAQQAKPSNYPAQPRSQSPSPQRPQSPAISRPQTPVDQRPRANSFGQVGPPTGLSPAPGPSKMSSNDAPSAERPPQRIPTVLRSGSPRPSPPSSGVPSRKPLPEQEVGHAM
ncbi:hypothetical protein GP486_007997 [Trichoglossum hirsutum]|uniref:SH3 domain-containing protein n=1 Tax=Trichoglossum hirsutum TaxID=265104 RepID=A0A9P8IHK7_9PEZI|nr:hypothetical protein GP486_007997 [Trichoglossum hirsutum]